MQLDGEPSRDPPRPPELGGQRRHLVERKWRPIAEISTCREPPVVAHNCASGDLLTLAPLISEAVSGAGFAVLHRNLRKYVALGS